MSTFKNAEAEELYYCTELFIFVSDCFDFQFYWLVKSACFCNDISFNILICQATNSKKKKQIIARECANGKLTKQKKIVN